jgi:nucleoside-diphosphate-sugar epimerase
VDIASPAPGTHLVVGRGPVGTALATQLAAAGADVVLASRTGSGPRDPRIRLVAADATDVDSLVAAAPTAAVVYNAVNPKYHRWVTDWPPIAAGFLAYAERAGAVLATVSNLYVYGPLDGPMREDSPLAATGPKARVRIAMWQEALAAHQAGRIRAVEVRGADYLTPGPQGLLGDRVMPRLLAGRSVQLIGALDEPHSWTAPADVARLAIAAAADERGWGKAWHVPSNPPRTQRQAVADLAGAAGVPMPKVGVVPPAVLRIVGLFVPMVREVKETDYQRDRPFILDDCAARATFDLAPTPWSDLLTAQVAAYADRK